MKAHIHSQDDAASAESPPGRARIGVSFKHLGCYGKAASVARGHVSLGDYISATVKRIMRALSTSDGDRVDILRGFQGLMLPGEMLLVLGRPGSGCSTFLRTLSGDVAGFKLAQGSSINYQGTSYDTFHRSFKGERIYVAELDVHFPELTLNQTLRFAVSARQPSVDATALAGEAAAHFGLSGALDTQVGDALVRGLSGGEKRRTSIAEAYLGGAQLQCWDNSTRGLDSLTATRLIRFLRGVANERKATVAMSLYQASERIYEDFDNVTLLYQGRQIYFGPTASAADYFIKMGFVRPERATTADFLTSLTNPPQRIVRTGYEDAVPQTADEFAHRWTCSEGARRLRDRIDRFEAAHPVAAEGVMSEDPEWAGALDKLRYVPRPPLPLRPQCKPTFSRPTRSTFTLSIVQQTSICLNRAWIRLYKTFATEASGMIANVILGVIIGSVFYGLDDTSDSLQRRAILLFFALIVNAFVPAAEVNKMWAQRPIVEKQYRYAFYHPVTERLASVICDMPAKVLMCFCIHLPIYYIASLRPGAPAFFVYWLFMFINMVVMSMLFRMIGSVSRTHMQTMVPISLAIILLVLYTDFIVPPEYQKPWLSWFRWINPLAYTFQSLLINEMRRRVFACSEAMMIPSGDGYQSVPSSHRMCAAVGGRLGEAEVDGSKYIELKYGYYESQLWQNLGVLLGMMAIFFFLHLLASGYILAQPPKGDVLTFRHGSRPKSDSTRQTKDAADMKLGPLHLEESDKTALDFNKDKVEAYRQVGCFHWQGIHYEVKAKGGKRQVLRDVNGWVQPGTLTALMGVTGAGKTSLLNVLADRAPAGTWSGDILVDGRTRDIHVQRKVGYVQQEDMHLPTQTVREAVQFSALLRQSRSIPTREKLEYADSVLDLLDMQAYADAFVSVPGEGLNIEQRKRLTIAVEMAAKPELLLFLDEPTSGLDSETAWSICTLLRKLVNNGQTILCTIHQPSAQILDMFDRLLLLNGSGRPVYFGDVGPSATSLVRYFETQGARPCAPDENPAEWMLQVTESPPPTGDGTKDILDGSNGSSGVRDDDKVDDVKAAWADKWALSSENNAVLRYLEGLKVEAQVEAGATPSRTTEAAAGGEYAASAWTQMLHVAKRIVQDQRYDLTYLTSKVLLPTCMALLNGISFYNTPHDIQGTTNLLFSIFLVTQMFTCINRVTIPHFIGGRSLFEARERDAKTYSWFVFVGANVLVELFWQTAVSVPVFASWYYPTGLARNGDAALGTAERGGVSFVLMWLFVLWSSTISQMFAALFEYVDMAMDLCVLFYWLVLVFCGVLATPDQLPGFWIFMYRVSPLTYLLEGLTVAGLYNAQVTCSSIEEVHLPLLPPSEESGASTCGEYLSALARSTGGRVLNPSSEDGDCRFCPLAEMNTLLDMFGMTVGPWRDVGLMAVYVCFNIAATFAIYWLARVPKKHKAREY